MNWTEKQNGNIKLVHHSTSSVIEMIIESDEEVIYGTWKKVKKSIWMDYRTFNDLREVMKDVDVE